MFQDQDERDHLQENYVEGNTFSENLDHNAFGVDGNESSHTLGVVIASETSEPENSGFSDVEIIEASAGKAKPNPQLKTTEAESYPFADKFEKLAQRLMKPLPDYPVKDSSHFVWEIKDWNSVRKENKVSSPFFECGGYQWRILLFPKGNSDSISLYMEPQPPSDHANISDPDWYICAQFGFDIWNPSHPASHHSSGSSHRFNKSETDWGFASFILLKDLVNLAKVGQQRPILENNQLNITGFVRIIDDSSTGVLWSNFYNYDSKASTTYVGLNNQGATCYLNSLLQSYFTTKVFRNLVCEIPTEDQFSTNKSSKAVALALQRIFYLMQSSNEPVCTLELTKSFGWDSSEAFTQHDVQELNRVLMDKLESAMKGSSIESSLNNIFVGKMKSFIKCVNVSYESARVEDFWDIQLNVKGFKNLQESFQNYIDIEMLDGENKYQAGEEHGYQDAKKGVIFESFPPVLHLQLKRFEYDFMVDDLVKIDDLYEFPDSIDLSPFLSDESKAESKSQNWKYKLHGVLVHQGSISNGHYYAMIKPAPDSGWLRFDDDRVWKVTTDQVFKENFGASDLSPNQIRLLTRSEQNEHLIRKATSAYMLVYYRETDMPAILPGTFASFPAHVSGQIEKERDELARIAESKREALHYLQVKIVTADNFTFYDGFDICPDPTKTKEYDPEIFDSRAYPRTIKVKKDANFKTVYNMVAQMLGYLDSPEQDNKTADANFVTDHFDSSFFPFSLLIMKQRNNKTNRPGDAVPDELMDETVDHVYAKCFRKKYDELAFFVRESRKELSQIQKQSSLISADQFNFDKTSEEIVNNCPVASSCPALASPDAKNLIHLFLKYFDPVTDTLRGLTFVSVVKSLPLSQIVTHVNNLLGFPLTTPLEFREEISRLKIESIDMNCTLEQNELGTGDILAVQPAGMNLSLPGVKLGDTLSHYKFLLTRLHLQVAPLRANEGGEDNEFVNDSVIAANLSAHSSNVSAPEAEDPHKSFDLWVSTTYTYEELASCIASKLGKHVSSSHLRIFVLNHQGVRLPLLSNSSLTQYFTRQVSVSSISQFEYEILSIPLKEYENMKAIKIHWLENIHHEQVFDLLVRKSSNTFALIEKLVQKLSLSRTIQSGLLAWVGQDNKYLDLIKLDRSVDEIDENVDFYCGYFPSEVEMLVSHDMYKRYAEPESNDGREIIDSTTRREFEKAQKYSKTLNIIPVFHFHKSTAYTHSIPFIFAAFPEEPFEETKARLRKKLGLASTAFEKIRIALADIDDKGRYLDVGKVDLSLLEEITKFGSHVSLALDHRDRNPKRSNPYDKGITIG